jgi:DNA replication and repair protein RecF
MRKDSRIDHNLLDALDFQMVTHGIPIHNARRKLIDLLNPLINQYTEKVSEKQQSGTMIYESKVGDDYGQLLKEYREKDYFTTRTNIGIHKDQLNCQMNEQSLNDYGSQGQIKTFVVAMKLAQFNYLRKYSGCTPLVLLDDIFAKLDEQRVVKLLEVLKSEELEQCFITDTHQDRLHDLIKKLPDQAYLYTIKNGILKQA